MRKAIKKIVDFIKSEVKQVKRLIQQYGTTAVHTLQVLKAFVDNDTVKSIVEATPTQIDDAVLKALRTGLGIMFGKSGKPNFSAVSDHVNSYVDKLRALPGEHRAAVYLKLASIIIRELAKKNGEEVSATDADTVAQLAYKAFKNDHVI